MADNEFQIEAIGDVYAQALVNLAQKQNLLDAVTDDVHSLAELVRTNAQLAAFLHAVTISPDEKSAALDRIFAGRVQQLTLQTLKSLARRDRLIFIRGFFAAYDAILAKLANRIDVELVSAAEIAPDSLQRIQTAIRNAIGKDPQITVTIDPALLGGIRLRIGDTLIDGSVDTQLHRLKQALQTTGVTRLQKHLDAVLSP